MQKWKVSNRKVYQNNVQIDKSGSIFQTFILK